LTHATSRARQILADIRKLDEEDQRLLLRELEALVERESGTGRTTLMALHGLGREVWDGIDAVEYVREERASWPG
jgi:hypothetical protein